MHLIHLPNAFGNAVENMALDSTLLQTTPKKSAVFRHYGWLEPTYTYGYTQHYRKIIASTPKGVHLCRRPTAGGIVDHRNDWTYSLILQAEFPSARLPIPSIYKQIHHCLQRALQQQQVEVHLAPCPKTCTTKSPPEEDPSRCFSNPVGDDLLLAGNAKLAGAAIKRTRYGILLQGSIDREKLPVGFNLEKFSTDFTAAISEQLGISINQPSDLRPLFRQPLLNDYRTRYADIKWQEKR